MFYWTAGQLPSDDTVKAALPIAIAVLGFIEFLLCSIALYYTCCCRPHHAVASTHHQQVLHTTTSNVYHPQPVTATYERPSCQPCAARQVAPPPQSSCQPCAAKQSFYSAGGMGGGYSGGMGGGFSGGMGGGYSGGGGCSSCPRPTTYNNYGHMAPNPAYNFYRS